jgi:hypothetical protein
VTAGDLPTEEEMDDVLEETWTDGTAEAGRDATSLEGGGASRSSTARMRFRES